MEFIGWIIAIVMFIIAFAGLVYPIIPSALFMVGGFLLYGLIDTFDGMTVWFWIIQVLFVILLFGADTLSNLVGVKNLVVLRRGCGEVQLDFLLVLLSFRLLVFYLVHF